MLRLMVQGDRDATGIEETVRALGILCKERGIGLNVGEAGKIVRILAETGAHVCVHQAKPEPPNVPKGFNGEIRDFNFARWRASDRQWATVHREGQVAWGARLGGLMAASDGFIFFPGREGTLAHLVPIMAFIAKGEVDKGVARPRRVALVEWTETKKDALFELFSVEEDDGEWLGSFDTGEMKAVVSWLTDGLPAT